MRPLPGSRVHIHPCDARARKGLGYDSLHLFGPQTSKGEVDVSTPGATGRHLLLVPTVMAEQPIARSVKRQRYRAVHTLPDLSARATLDEGCVSAPVQEEDRLLFPFQALAYRTREPFGEDASALLPATGLGTVQAKIHDLHRRHASPTDSFGQRQTPELTDLRVPPTLQRGSRAPEDADGTGEAGAHHRNVSGMVARSLGLLVRAVVLLVDNDRAEVSHGCEQRGSGAHDHAPSPGTDLAPLIVALAIGEP